GEAFTRHTGNPRSRTPAGDVGPMVFEELHVNVALGKQPDIIEQLAGGNGSGTFFFYARGTGATDSKLEVCSSQSDAITRCFEQYVREDRYRGFLFDDTLRQAQFSYQIGLADGKF